MMMCLCIVQEPRIYFFTKLEIDILADILSRTSATKVFPFLKQSCNFVIYSIFIAVSPGYLKAVQVFSQVHIIKRSLEFLLR
jgi:hypothetical protein